MRVSLVATVYNEAESIAGWLDSIASQSRPPDELVIVDAGSRDGTVEAIERAGLTIPVRVLVAEGANVPRGRNLAFEAASGPIVAVTDAGTRLDPHWLARLVAPLEADPAVSVSAGFFRPYGETAFEKVLASVITPRWPEIDPERFLPSSRSVALRRDWWARSGGYPEWLRAGEDLVFDMRLKRAGAVFVCAPDAIVSWRPRTSLLEFFRQYRHYARGDGHGHLWPKRHALRYAAYACGLWLLTTRRRRSPARLALVAGFVGYMRKFWWRLADERPFDRPAEMAAAYAFAPVIVVVGDVAKLVGYPQGLWERFRAGGPERLAGAAIRPHRHGGDGRAGGRLLAFNRPL